MHRRFLSLITGCALVTIIISPSKGSSTESSDWISLWNGKDFEGWSTWLSKPEPRSEVPRLTRDPNGRYSEPIGANRDPLKVFTIDPLCDGKPAIRISGECFGELRTNRLLENYHLKLEFKWGQKKWPPRDDPDSLRDSGLLYHVHSAPGVGGRTWARSIEFQIQEGDVGDLYSVGSAIAVRAKVQPKSAPSSYIYDPSGSWTYFSQIPGQTGRCIKNPDAEKPSGEWNTLELICLGQDCIHIVNGKVVMRLHSPMQIDGEFPVAVTSGQILLQSEGAEVFYREIKFRPISAIPAGYTL